MTPETLYQPLNSIRTEYRLRMNRSADLAAEFAAEGDMQSVSEHSTESERCREAFQAMNRAIFAVDEYYAALSAQQREPVVREQKFSKIMHQIALWSDDEGLDLSTGQGDALTRRIISLLWPEDSARSSSGK